MSPDQLTELLTSLDQPADVVEAIDRPALQVERGWDLAQWRYDLIPWGVRFTYHGFNQAYAEILAVMALHPWKLAPRPTALVQESPWMVLAMH